MAAFAVHLGSHMSWGESEPYDPTPANLRDGLLFVQFCTSWSYRGTYNQVRNLIHQNCFPTSQSSQLDVAGGEYPPTPEKVALASLVWYIQLILFGLIFFMEKLFDLLELPMPEQCKQVTENKFACFMLVWLFGNSIQGALLSTGAFEIYHGHEKIWSSLDHNRLPAQRDLLTAFKRSGIDCIQQQAVRRN